MIRTRFRNRSAFVLENEHLRITMTEYGGHIAEILHKATQVSPLWQPQWSSLEPTEWNASCEESYGPAYDGEMLSCVLGHFVCLDTFGIPSVEERAAGAVLHGEALLTRCSVSGNESTLTFTWEIPISPLRMTRTLTLPQGSFVLKIVETVENYSTRDHPTAWTQHVTLGAPFLAQGSTQFNIPDVRAMNLGGEEIKPELTSTFTSCESTGSFVTHLLDQAREQSFFMAYSPSANLLHGYIWSRADFPWLGVWEEVRSRQHAPWNGQTVARGMEFGVSPFPESRKEMITRQELFGTPTYRWVPAKSSITAEYCAFLLEGKAMPSDVHWNKHHDVTFA